MTRAWTHYLLLTIFAVLVATAGTLTPSIAWADGEETDASASEAAAETVEAPVEEVPYTDSPRDTMRTFLRSSNEKKLSRAVACLDFSKIDGELDDASKFEYVAKLHAVIDRLGWVQYEQIPDDKDGPPFLWPADESDQPIEIVRGEDGRWQFSADLVANLDELYDIWKDKPVAVAWHQTIFLGTEIWKYGIIFLSLLIAWIVGRIAKSMLSSSGASLEKRNRYYTGSTLQSLSRAVVPFALVMGLSVGLQFLQLQETVRQICDTVVAVLYTIAVAYTLYCLVDVIAVWLTHFSEKTSSKLDDMLAPMVTTTARGTIIVLALVQIATILSDKPMTSVIAGLGVGGLAIGLAAQDMIKNFFGSLMIFSDQPFELGDRVVISGVDGTVESVGFRSTRLRTLDGHLVTMPNGDVANSAVRNITARPNIKRSFGVTVTYDTPTEQVQRAIDILGEILHEHEGMDPEMPARIYFNDMTDIALSIQVIYWYHPPDYWAYSAFSQRVNFEILSRFNAEGIEFAFPTQTLFLAGDTNRPLQTSGG